MDLGQMTDKEKEALHIACVSESASYSVFKFKRYDEISKIWAESYSLYIIDFLKSNIDLSTDWRFKEVKNKRSQGVFIGNYNGFFPVIMPIENNKNFIPFLQTTS